MNDSVKSDIIYLSKVLSHALLEIREEALTSNLSKSYHLADLVHNLPSHLAQAAIYPGDTSLEDVVSAFEKRVKNSKIEFWVKGIKES